MKKQLLKNMAMPPLFNEAFLVVGLSLALLSCGLILDNDDSNKSGIEGTVLRGPTCPVVRENDPCPDQPFAAPFYVFGEKGKDIATFQSDEQGHFRVALDPGEYAIVPDESAPILFPKNQRKTVVVHQNQFTEVTLLFDTGIR